MAETPTAKQRRIWDQMAPSYDRQIAFFERVWFTGGREWIAERASGNVLEVAIGTGRNDAELLPFDDASFDTIVCALALCSIPDPAQAVAEMYRVLVPGGQLLLLDHVRSTWPPLLAGQWLVEQVTRRAAGEYLTRRQLPHVLTAGFTIEEQERLKAGTVERIRAVKPPKA